MALPKLEKDISYISKLSDEPNDIGGSDGLSASDLKQRFDAAGNDIKNFINNELVPAIASDIAAAAEGVSGEGQFDSDRIADGAVTEAKIADGAVTEVKLGLLAVGTSNLKNESVTGEKLAKDSVGRDALQDESVTTNKLFIGAIITEKIKDSAVTSPKIADKAVGLAKLGDDVPSAFAPAYTVSTEDLIAGSSSLESGRLYLVYE